MAIDPNAVGQKGQPSKRSWNSKDALLYAVGIGAGTDELQYTTENTKDITQKVFPTFAVIIGGGGIPMKEVGSFNPALMVHGEQGIELSGEIPPDDSCRECPKDCNTGNYCFNDLSFRFMNTCLTSLIMYESYYSVSTPCTICPLEVLTWTKL